MSVRFLEHDRSKPNETKTVDRKVEAIIRHLRYNPGTYDNDIALLKLDQRVRTHYDINKSCGKASRDKWDLGGPRESNALEQTTKELQGVGIQRRSNSLPKNKETSSSHFKNSEDYFYY